MELTEKIREAASLVEIVSQYTTLKKRGHKWVGLCPFHTEKTPSFTVDEDKQLYHCFGCGAGGDIFTMVMEKENLNFPEAVRYLAERYHIPVPRERDASPGEIKLEEKLFRVNDLALDFFRDNLAGSQEGRRAQEYLKKRAISPETIQELKIGYAMNSWTTLYDHLRSKNVPAGFIEKAGLVLPGKKQGEYYDRFRGRIIFPILSLSGKTVGFGGRTIFDVDPKYLNSPETPLYSKGRILYGLNLTKGAVRDQGFIILVEGYMDFTALYQAGIRNAAASLGTALTGYQAGLAGRFAPRVVLNYDPDQAGRTASARAVPICMEKGINISVVNLPQGLDPDAFVGKYGVEKYQTQVKRATPGLKFYIDALAARADLAVPEEKSRVVREVIKELEKISDPVARNEYLREAAQLLKTDEAVLRNIMDTDGRESQTWDRTAGRVRPPAAAQAFFEAEKRLFQLLVQDKGLAVSLADSVEDGLFAGLKSGPAFDFILGAARGGRTWELQDLINALPKELFIQLSQWLFEKSGPGSLEEAQECLNALREVFLNGRVSALQREIASLGDHGEPARITELQAEKGRLTKMLISLNDGKRAPGGPSPTR